MPENFLAQLVQSGALNVPNPMESYRNVLAMKKAQIEVEGAPLEKRTKELDIESKMLTVAKGYLARINDRSEYPKFRAYMVDTLGANPDLFPESFESDEAFEDYRTTATASADELLKMRQGKPFTVSIPMLDDAGKPTGQHREIEVKDNAQLKDFQEKGLLPEDAVLGKITGTLPEKAPLKPGYGWVKTVTGEIIEVEKGKAPPGAMPYVKPEKESALQEKINAIGVAHPTWTYQKIVDEATNVEPEELKPAQNYLLPDKTIVRSFDGGRTYEGPDRKTYPMPYTAVKVTATITGEDLAAIEAKKRVAEEAPLPSSGKPKLPSAEEAALGGTGPYAKFMAGFNAVAGGIGFDKAFGAQGIFPETEQNRELLRVLRQKGKAAWMVGGRGAIWEQKRIDALWPDPDKWWRNPRTEMQKIPILRQVLTQEREFYRQAISTALPKEISKLREAQREIESVLDLLGTGTTTPAEPVTEKRQKLLEKYK